MRVVIFVHSLVSDWNHGNAHFLRGVARELQRRGHDVDVYEPAGGWSRAHLIEEAGPGAIVDFHRAFPTLSSHTYRPGDVDLAPIVDHADLVLVHEWNDPDLVAAIGQRRRHAQFRLLFHDTHHRAASAPEQMARYDLSEYDGVLAFGAVIADLYRDRGWAERAWVWHEAADVELFRPAPGAVKDGDVVWVGNWGDDERTAEIDEFLLGPVRTLRLTATVHGVRYPAAALAALTRAGVRYGSWLPNHRVPEVFGRHRLTVHIPRRPYTEMLPGIPTIRMFEALACGIPLITAPWDDCESLFTAGRDYLVARTGEEMGDQMRTLLGDEEAAGRLAQSGLQTILSGHTCSHRVDELLEVAAGLKARASPLGAEGVPA